MSLVALTLLGAGDMVSVYIRHLLVQLETPDAIRGRVSAVNGVFIGASNELGEFESGVVAALVGAVPAVLIGGMRDAGGGARSGPRGSPNSGAWIDFPPGRDNCICIQYARTMRRADRHQPQKGRGAVTNPAGRFEHTTLEPVDDGWDDRRTAACVAPRPY